MLPEGARTIQRVQDSMTFNQGTLLGEKIIFPLRGYMFAHLVSKFHEHLIKIDFMHNNPRSLLYVGQSLGSIV